MARVWEFRPWPAIGKGDAAYGQRIHQPPLLNEAEVDTPIGEAEQVFTSIGERQSLNVAIPIEPKYPMKMVTLSDPLP